MKKLFLAGAIGISIAAFAATQQSQKGSSSVHGNQIAPAYRDTVPKRDTTKWPKDTLPKHDSINLQ